MDLRKLIDPEQLTDFDAKTRNYHVLNAERRALFLKLNGVEESDNIYIYDYQEDAVSIRTVRSRRLVGVLSAYSYEPPFLPEEFQVGLEVGEDVLVGAQQSGPPHSWVHFGRQNPFMLGQMRRVVWTDIASPQFPAPRDGSKDSAAKSTTAKRAAVEGAKVTVQRTFKTSSSGYDIYVQDYVVGNLQHRHLAATKIGDKTVLFERLYTEGEGRDLTGLKDAQGRAVQWVGTPLKNFPPIIFPMVYESFGCPVYLFIHRQKRSLYLNCDNRH